MAAPIVMPRLGWAMEEGTLIEWRKRDGERVETGEIVCVIEGEKAEQEVESFDAGILRIPSDSPAPGARVPVGTLLGWVVAPGELVPATAPAADGPGGAGAAAGGTGPVTARAPAAAGSRLAGPAASPRARRAARELGVEWTGLRGSGRTGRILERDVRAAAVAATPTTQAASIPLRGVRRVVAERMAASARTVAPVTLTTEADATALVRIREQLVTDLGARAPAPSYTDLAVKLAAIALGEHPALNASLDGDGVVQHREIHVGVAVDTERGLLVPVLRDVPSLSLQALAARSAALVEGARAGRLPADALRGGTFTVSNLGMYDVDAFTPIVNLPECAILGLGRLVPRPVVVDEAAGRIEVRRMLTLSLTFDHRVVDGAPAARFLQTVKRFVERPGLWLTR